MSISVLPPEILGMIFVYTQPDPLRIGFHHQSQHTVLTQVCRRWRAVISSTPSLWTRLSIQFTDPLRLDRSIQIAEWCLTRSRDFPVTLHAFVHHQTPSYTTPASMSNKVVQRLIRPNAHRWQKLNLIITPESFYSLLTLPAGSFLNLKELTVQINTKYPQFTPCSTWIGLARSPLLTSLKLSTLGNSPIKVENLQCPWSQLTHVDLSTANITAKSCYAILRECHYVEIFLALLSPSSKSFDVSHPITLPHLHSFSVILSLTTYFSTFELKFFAPFVTPNLRYFYFNCWGCGGVLSIIDFPAFQFRSNFQLEHLELMIEIRDRPAFHELLTSCPSLLKLKILDESFLENNDGFVTGAVIPKLEHLALMSGQGRSSELLAIIDARTRPGYPFPLKRLEAWAGSVAALSKGLEEFIARGLQPVGLSSAAQFFRHSEKTREK